MIYGLNFNNTQIPAGVKRKFAQNVKKDGKFYDLKGVGQSTAERDAMLIQVNNGNRLVHVKMRETAAGPWFGIYVAWY